jgi:hypothetical protein
MVLVVLEALGVLGVLVALCVLGVLVMQPDIDAATSPMVQHLRTGHFMLLSL